MHDRSKPALDQQDGASGISSSPHPLFDPHWYAQQNPDLPPERATFGHYLTEGWRNMKSPHPLFSVEYYFEQRPDVKAAGLEPLTHFVTRGWREGTNPHPDFDVDLYLSQDEGAGSDFSDSLSRYRTFGRTCGLTPNRFLNSAFGLGARHGVLPYVHASAAEQLENFHHIYNAYFDANYYKKTYPYAIELTADVSKTLACYINNVQTCFHSPSPYFNTAWYLANGGHIDAGVDPILDYVSRGWKLGLSANQYFDVQWYLQYYSDVRESGTEPMLHFLRHGQFEGRRAHPTFSNAFFLWQETPPTLAPIFAPLRNPSPENRLSPAPLVSIIVTNMDGVAHLPALFDSLDGQTYRNFEVIFVDDASKDRSAEFARDRGAKVIQLLERKGFAEANNIGLAESKGELIALLNNDMRVDPNWLESMISTIKVDNTIGAVAPLIRFWCKFQRLEFSAALPFNVETGPFRGSLKYQKYFIRTGEEIQSEIVAKYADNAWKIVIDIPIQTEPFQFFVTHGRKQVLTILSGTTATRIVARAGRQEISFILSETLGKGGFFIINNAGSIDIGGGLPADRAFGEVDQRQFNSSELVPFLCGGAALIRRDALLGYPLFIGEFIAYYEDSELSVRLHRNGYRINFDPRAIVYHRHSATNVEKSTFWRTYTLRNNKLFCYLFATCDERLKIKHHVRLDLNHLEAWYRSQPALSSGEAGFLEKIPEILADLDRLFRVIDASELPVKSNLRVGLFNPYWGTFGGGEAHALHFAEAFASYGQVELISTDDFDIDVLVAFFGCGGLNARKRIVRQMTPELSGEYDIFINSAFQSEMPSMARHSYFILSFPSKTPSTEFLDSYKFFANSAYTLSWAERWWGKGNFVGDIIYPAVDDQMSGGFSHAAKKSKVILSVGRFASSGHTKNQKEIVLAYQEAVARDPVATQGWKLVLVGSANDENYVKEITDLARGSNVEIILDAPFAEVVKQYSNAAIYVHASGIGHDEHSEPELLEHFGMAVAQAAGSGCYPVVYGAAGPKEIIDLIGDGVIYYSTDELVSALLNVIARSNCGALEQASTDISARARIFSRDAQRNAIHGLLSRDLVVAQKIARR